METIRVKTVRRTQFIDVTAALERLVGASGVSFGVCYIYVPHTTAGVTINEHADPDVATDLEGVFDRLVPRDGPYRHNEGNSDAQSHAGGRESGHFPRGWQAGAGTLAGHFFLRIRWSSGAAPSR